MQNEKIKVKGHRGTWYITDELYYEGETYYLLENEQDGDEVPGLIINEEGKLILDNVVNGFLDLMELKN